MPTALITGVAGQDGAYLSALLRDKGYRVIGLIQPDSEVASPLRPLLDGVELVAGDVRDASSLRAALACDPDEVYNLAGISSVARSWQEPELTAEVNALGVLRLVQAVLDHSRDVGRAPRLLQASSAEIFGSPDVVPQDEGTPLRPRNPYAVAKAFAHETVATYRAGHGLHASTVILYNHESPLRPPAFVTRKITRTVAAISLGQAEELVLGDLDIQRDWGYAPDYVRAMWLAVQHEVPDDYVVATGKAHSIRDLVAAAFAEVGIADWTHLVRSDPAFVRPTDAPLLVGDASKARRVLSWAPSLDFGAMVAEMVRHDVADLRAGRALA